MLESNYISFIGAGNVAWHLAPALDNAGYYIREVYSRTHANAKALVKKLYQAEVSVDLDFSASKSKYFILSVPDDAISDIAQEIVLPDHAILLHTSGAQSMGILSYAASDFMGVFYPLQTFSKKKRVDFDQIPICIEANNRGVEKLLMEMGKAISKSVSQVSSEDRKALHVAAVFACNFTNHFLTISNDILRAKKLKFDMLKPLIAETINKAFELGPLDAQTGPAKRHDFETLDQHLAFLDENEELSELYRMVSQHIVDTYPLD